MKPVRLVKNILICTCAWVTISCYTLFEAKAQQKKPRSNAVYAEVGGNAVLYSVNYERRWQLSEKTRLCPSFGYSWMKDKIFAYDDEYKPGSFNLRAALLTGHGTRFCETGIGMNLFPGKEKLIPKTTGGPDYDIGTRAVIYKSYTAFIGYRYEAKKGFVFRATFNPMLTQLISFPVKYQLLPWAGFSVGYCFQ